MKTHTEVGTSYLNIPSLRAAAWSLGKYCELSALFAKVDNLVLGELTGVPNPVTASHPVLAGKPVVLHPIADPFVMSVKAEKPME